jgi:hypothetical protein
LSRTHESNGRCVPCRSHEHPGLLGAVCRRWEVPDFGAGRRLSSRRSSNQPPSVGRHSKPRGACKSQRLWRGAGDAQLRGCNVERLARKLGASRWATMTPVARAGKLCGRHPCNYIRFLCNKRCALPGSTHTREATELLISRAFFSFSPCPHSPPPPPRTAL